MHNSRISRIHPNLRCTEGDNMCLSVCQFVCLFLTHARINLMSLQIWALLTKLTKSNLQYYTTTYGLCRNGRCWQFHLFICSFFSGVCLRPSGSFSDRTLSKELGPVHGTGRATSVCWGGHKMPTAVKSQGEIRRRHYPAKSRIKVTGSNTDWREGRHEEVGILWKPWLKSKEQ